MKDFELEKVVEVIQPGGTCFPVDRSSATLSKVENNSTTANSPETIKQAAAQNFGKILELAGGLVELGKIKVVSDAVLAKMEADRKQLLSEAEVYVAKKNADTKSDVDRMNIIRLMMLDFYQQSNQQITSEDFKQIIKSIVDQMGK